MRYPIEILPNLVRLAYHGAHEQEHKNKDEGFPYHVQSHEQACGIACLRMLQDWLTNNSDSEWKWRHKLAKGKKWVKITKEEFKRDGIRAEKMGKLLEELAQGCEVSEFGGNWTEIPAPGNKHAYVVLMDYWKKASDSKKKQNASDSKRIKNPRHYIIVYDFCEYWYKKDSVSEPPSDPSNPKGKKQKRIWVARYNCTQDGAGCWWAWDSLLASRVHKIWEIKCR